MAEEKDLRAEEEQDGAQLENDAQDAVSEEAESEDTGSSGGGKKKKSGKSITAIVLLCLAIVLFVAGGALGLTYWKNYQHLEEMKAAVDVEGYYPGIIIDGEDVGGRSYEDVRQEFLDRQQAEADARVISVQANGQVFTLPAQSAYDTEQVLVDAYNYAKEGSLQERYDLVAALAQQPLNFTTSCSVTVDGVDAFVQQVASAVNVDEQDAQVGAFDAATKTFTFTDEVNGQALDEDALRSAINTAVESGDFSTQITAQVNEVPAAVTRAELEAQNTLLASFTTKTTSSKSRNTNIRLCSEAFNGYVVAPGEIFSINGITGPRTTAKGYKEAGSIQNGIMIQEPGGGVCQVSSTLYNAVVFAGLKTTERHAHTYEPSYVTPGEDAMVSYDGYAGPDLRFVNNSKTAVGIKAAYSNQTLTVSIYGNPILEDGVTVSMHSEKIKELDPPTPTYVEDPTLEPGVEVVAKAATPGSRWQTKLITKKNGQVVSDVLLHNSTYTGKAATIKRNTSGTVAATESASADASAASSEAAGETTAAAPAETTAEATR